MRNSEFGIIFVPHIYRKTKSIIIRNEIYFEFFFYTKHHLKFGKNQADNLVAVENRFILDFGADFFLYFIGV